VEPETQGGGASVRRGCGVIPLSEEIAALAALPRGKRLMGFDLGTKTIGLAVSDVDRRFASPLETVPRTKLTKDVARIQVHLDHLGVGGLVFGLPINMDGSEGPRAQATRAFVRHFVRLAPLPFAFWDERLSTAAVDRAMISADMSRARRAEAVDRAAAAYILQGVLDRISIASDH
jgi:putative Holliday junction resolvase